ncbi:carbohydrate binding domain-containing protein [Polaribacter sp. IC073]|uniref:carbohydrate binding domain-containing protein n=1 Tax=Polaribacter sp. IC073 TaxID=2508540 RepID=UPI0011BF3663|nr:carbohydrate binding domain-containing protein [Polaribacter sp. IC073]TXD47233.1 hypothetical protein ES045_11575 [Polaribacter sp. IC073]
MKYLKTIYKAIILLIFVSACTESENLDFLDNIPVPTNIAATYNISQDNTGVVTITPTAEGATSFDVYYGDATATSVKLEQGKKTVHTYAEGNYDVKVVAYNSVGKTAEFIQPLVVSFQAPQNLMVTVANDASVSKQLNIKATADFAAMYDFYSGEADVSQPVATVNIGEVLKYQYKEAGTYDIKVVAKGGAIATAEYTVNFEVTEILAPLKAAPTPPKRDAADVISIFSDAYTNVTLNELPTSWSLTGFDATTIENNNVWKLSNLDFLGMVTNYDNGIDISSMEKLHIDYWVPTETTNELSIKIVNTVDSGEAVASLGTTAGGSWQSIEIDMAVFDGGNLANKNKITQILIDSDGLAGIVYIANFYFYKASTVSSFDDGLLINGDFENGSDSWIVGVDNNAPVSVVTNGGNTYYSADVTAAGNSYDVNVSQKLEILQGKTYTLTFDAWSDANRSIIAGIGLSGGDFSNDSKPVNITATRTTYSLILSSTNFGAADARVLFDLGAETGLVNIDNVSLIIGTGNIVTNGNFENGNDSWLIGVDDNAPAPVVTNGDNTYYSVDVTAAGNSYDVNLSQKLEIIQGSSYTLTFDAWSEGERSIIAGIGLSGGDFSSDSKPVNITATRTTYTISLSSDNFGATDARVLFDLGAETGVVNIDDVSLSSN